MPELAKKLFLAAQPGATHAMIYLESDNPHMLLTIKARGIPENLLKDAEGDEKGRVVCGAVTRKLAIPKGLNPNSPIAIRIAEELAEFKKRQGKENAGTPQVATDRDEDIRALLGLAKKEGGQ